jgi:L-2-hydroxyglutarate oxidase LhgO
MAEQVPTLVIGAGVLGAAVAHALRDHEEPVFLVEAEAHPCMGNTSRNSGVIHAGLYYPADSLKMKLCRQGAAMLYEFADQHGVPVLKCGKYLVANNEDESRYLDLLRDQVDAPPLHEVDAPAGIRARRTLYSPNTGLVEIHALVDALLLESGVEPLYGQRVEQLTATGDSVAITINGEAYEADHVINCAGLQATDFVPNFRHYLAKGSYFRIQPPANPELPHLVYPAVPKHSASLGIHLTRNLQGETYLGPDLEWTEREYYGVDENRRDLFFEAAVRYLPWLEPQHLAPGYAGIRPKLAQSQFRDFLFHREGDRGQLIHCLGIESPGLTAAMAIAAHIRHLLTH